jgi:hypothetical protein
MANALGINLTGSVVILRQSFFRDDLVNTEHPFRCTSGFGCRPFTSGGMIGGTFLSDGEDTAIRGNDVERLATPWEIEQVTL